jgi:HrpA-like helicases
MLKNPVWEIKNELQEALKNCQTIIIEGSSHTDKSVQIPRMALEILTQFKYKRH